MQRRNPLLVDFRYLSIRRRPTSRFPGFQARLAARPERCDLRRGKEDHSTAWRLSLRSSGARVGGSGKKKGTGNWRTKRHEALEQESRCKRDGLSVGEAVVYLPRCFQHGAGLLGLQLLRLTRYMSLGSVCRFESCLKKLDVEGRGR